MTTSMFFRTPGIKSLVCLFSLSLLVFGLECKGQKMKPIRKQKLKISEPSDVCLNQTKDGFYIVSDDGFLFETNLDGRIKRKSSFRGFDFEAVFCDQQGLYVVDERIRTVHTFRFSDLTISRTKEVSYNGGRNKGFESLTWNEVKKCYVMFTEKDPSWVYELDSQFNVLSRQRITGLADISAAAFKEGKLFLLSDEDHAVFRIDPTTYTVEKKVALNVLNPEGLTFDPDGNLVIVSDDMGVLFTYDSKILFE